MFPDSILCIGPGDCSKSQGWFHALRVRQLKNIKNKGTVRVNSSDSLCKNGNARFTTAHAWFDQV